MKTWWGHYSVFYRQDTSCVGRAIKVSICLRALQSEDKQTWEGWRVLEKSELLSASPRATLRLC